MVQLSHLPVTVLIEPRVQYTTHECTHTLYAVHEMTISFKTIRSNSRQNVGSKEGEQNCERWGRKVSSELCTLLRRWQSESMLILLRGENKEQGRVSLPVNFHPEVMGDSGSGSTYNRREHNSCSEFKETQSARPQRKEADSEKGVAQCLSLHQTGVQPLQQENVM